MDYPYPKEGPRALGLDALFVRACRSPFLKRKLDQAGVGPECPADWESWWAIAPTTKEELRRLRSFEEEFCPIEREAVVEYWRSGGVTGRPFFYPRTATDIEASQEAFARGLRLAGVGPSDAFMCSLPIGIHPAGQQLARAAERIGAATLWAGAGNQTPSATQIELIHELGVTVWSGMASFGLHLAHLAEAAGRSLAESRVRVLVTTAEPLSHSKRELLAKLWGARVVDVFGLSEITLFGAECGRRPGHHIWCKNVFCEVLDPDTLRPAPRGAVGVLCVSAISPSEATPFLRWLSGDLVRLEQGCECSEKDEPRLVHSGRTTDFFKVKGVNLNHAEFEEALYRVPDLRDYQVLVTAGDRLQLRLECVDGSHAQVREAVDRLLAEQFGLRGDIAYVERGTIAKEDEKQVKARRFIDQRETT